MKSNMDEAISAYRQAMMDFIGPIQTIRVIKDNEFEKLHAAAVMLMRAFKGKDCIPKDVLADLYMTYGVLRAEAPYFGENREKLEEMAGKIQTCFGLILGNEVPEDRQPGIPRIF
ncbi:hypothetical protein M2103_001693 [Ereboglobus sp. PH5-5]|uniref:hypothetical protein n=1 Tax=Ereboglobus sp. PH5-5 TaxID=2940529 RepID=UPI002406A46F|nr:hypothetical protein [Ereboglobus sp. PH5-5]MDF9833469.1 hypothetical protein [Ereboglobus sp. PH5-5]